jgi:hypothetical protein
MLCQAASCRLNGGAPILHPFYEQSMNFSDLTNTFDASAPGTDAFLEVKRGMLALIGDDPDRATAYFLIYGFARSYVILHDDEPIAPGFAHASKNQLLAYMRTVDAALDRGAEALLAASRDIIKHYLDSGKPF